jgi:hypothetical protein
VGEDKKKGKGDEEEGEDAVATGARRGLDNKGLRIPEGKEGYVEGARHEGHVHLFADAGDQLGAWVGPPSVVWKGRGVWCV